MASLWHKMIFIAAILAITIPISTCHRTRLRRSDFLQRGGDTEQILRDICSQTDKSDVCWNILNKEISRFDNSDDRDIVNGILDLAIEKAKVIGDQLNKWFRDSNDDNMKDKYGSCSDSYSDVERNLKDVHQYLDSDDYRRISDLINEARDQLEKCKQEFGSTTFDSGHVGDRNNELELYLDMVRVASDRLGNY